MAPLKLITSIFRKSSTHGLTYKLLITHQPSQCALYWWILVNVMEQQMVFNFRKINIYRLDMKNLTIEW
jgi:hypothetical protein